MAKKEKPRGKGKSKKRKEGGQKEADVRRERANDLNDLEIIMAYTGWSAEIAAAAIKQWRQYDTEWNARYVLAYFCKGGNQYVGGKEGQG